MDVDINKPELESLKKPKTKRRPKKQKQKHKN